MATTGMELSWLISFCSCFYRFRTITPQRLFSTDSSTHSHSVASLSLSSSRFILVTWSRIDDQDNLIRLSLPTELEALLARILIYLYLFVFICIMFLHFNRETGFRNRRTDQAVKEEWNGSGLSTECVPFNSNCSNKWSHCNSSFPDFCVGREFTNRYFLVNCSIASIAPCNHSR